MIFVTRPYLPELKEYIRYLKKIWKNKWLTNNGEFVRSLEVEQKKYLKVKNLLLTTNGMLGLQLTLKALDLTGEVITTPFTFAATTNVLVWEGLTPVFADIDPETYNIDPIDVERKITKKTSAILAVHVYGNPCDVITLQRIARKYELKLIYDAAHAFGVKCKGRSVLEYGDASVVSFHATKMYNTIEGGAIVVKDKMLIKKLKLLRDFGIESEEKVVLPGINAKMNEFQAAMGLCNLKSIGTIIKKRKVIYERYKDALSDLPSISFQRLVTSQYNYIYMPVCFSDKQERDNVYGALRDQGIMSRKYFYPLTTEAVYFKGKNLIKKFKLDNAKNVADRILCLPIYPDLGLGVVDRITSLIKRSL